MKSNKLSIFLKGLIAENPVLVLILGTCPTLAQTGSVINALSMGVAAGTKNKNKNGVFCYETFKKY